MRFDTKIAVVLRGDLAPWQALNVTAFLISGIAGTHTDLLGEPYTDADGTTYLPMFGQPVLVLSGDASVLAAAHTRAIARDLPLSVFTEQLFGTGNDQANRAAVRAVSRDDLRLAGLGLYGPKNAVDKTVTGSQLHL